MGEKEIEGCFLGEGVEISWLGVRAAPRSTSEEMEMISRETPEESKAINRRIVMDAIKQQAINNSNN